MDNLPNAKGSIPIRNSNGVCIKHFDKSFILGNNRKFLTPDAYPTIFGDVHLTLNNRPSPSERFEMTIAKVMKYSLETFEKEKQQKLVSCLKDIENNFEKTDLRYNHLIQSDHIFFTLLTHHYVKYLIF